MNSEGSQSGQERGIGKTMLTPECPTRVRTEMGRSPTWLECHSEVAVVTSFPRSWASLSRTAKPCGGVLVLQVACRGTEGATPLSLWLIHLPLIPHDRKRSPSLGRQAQSF